MESSVKTKTNCYVCQFRQNCIFDALEAPAQKIWNEGRSVLNLKDGQIIYSETQKPAGVYVVCRGRAKVYSTDAKGQQMITSIHHPGELFGHIALFSAAEYFCNAEAMNAVTLSHVDARSFLAFLEKFPRTYPLMLKKMANEVKRMQFKLKDTAYKPAKAKVASALLQHVSFKSKNTAVPTIYGLKRTEIAEITGLALETVVRILADLEKKKVIKRETKSLKILDKDTLVKIAHQAH